MATPQGPNDEPANQRIASAFQTHYETFVKAIDPDKAAVALFSNKIINKTTLEEATNDKDIRFRRSLKVVEAVQTFLEVCDSSSDAFNVISILEKHASTSTGFLAARIRRDSMSSYGGEYYTILSTM